MFDFNQPHFVWRFVTGDTRYWMEPIDFGAMVRYYREHDRSVLAQELNLSPPQRLKLQQFVQVNALPQNKFYRYDYYRDNCSTRLRDALDHALSGQLQTATVSRMTSGTYRWHTQRLMTGDIPLYTGVTLALGHPADKPLSMWQEMFLPKELHDWVATRTIRDSSGATRPLVKRERVLFQARRAPEPSSPPDLRSRPPHPIICGCSSPSAFFTPDFSLCSFGAPRVATAGRYLAQLRSPQFGVLSPAWRVLPSSSPGYSPSTISWAGMRTCCISIRYRWGSSY